MVVLACCWSWPMLARARVVPTGELRPDGFTDGCWVEVSPFVGMVVGSICGEVVFRSLIGTFVTLRTVWVHCGSSKMMHCVPYLRVGNDPVVVQCGS